MKRFITLLAIPLVLAACGSSEAAYLLTFDTSDPAKANDLTQMSARVMERRMDRLEQDIVNSDITSSVTGATITVTLPNQASVEALTYELTQPFSMKIMKEVPSGQGRLTVEGHGDFADTIVRQEDLQWAEWAEDSRGKGAIRLIFTPEGKTRLATVLKENMGNSIGIFVRDRLISKLNIKTDTVDDEIVIRDIPNAELARVFVEDLNVGLHVTFTPLP